MAQAGTQELVDRFEGFYREYYRRQIGQLAQRYPNEQRSLHVDWNDLYQFDRDLAEDYLAQPDQLREYAEEALRLYDLPVDVSLGQAHVRVRNLPEITEIREIRSRDVNSLVSVQGIIRKATDVRPKVQEAAFECQRCGTLTYIPQSGGFQEPHECQGCERQGPFTINYDQSAFIDAQKLRIQESPEGLRGGETPQSIDVHIEDDVTGKVTPGDHVTVAGVLRIEQQESQGQKSRMFDVFMDCHSLVVEDEEFEEMDITEEDKRAIVELSRADDLYDQMVDSIAPTIFGYEGTKLAMTLQLFSGVTKHLPDETRIRGDMHMLLIGDPGTGKCVDGDTMVTLGDGREVRIRELVESNLDDPKPVDDGVYGEVDIALPTMQPDGSITEGRATRVWKREAPDKMLRVRTKSGKEIEVTPSHPLFVHGGARLIASRADQLSVGQEIATAPHNISTGAHAVERSDAESTTAVLENRRRNSIASSEIIEIQEVPLAERWVYDLEISETHTYISNGIVSHNSQLLQYVRNIAPRSVYTSGKGSTSAGLTASAVRDDFGDGQQWSLEAGALVLADKGIAAVDELDKMRCVTGDTLVHTSDGIRPIRDLAIDATVAGTIEELENGRTIRGHDLDVWTMADDGRLVERDVTAIHEYDAPDELQQVVLESGESLTSTADHPFFVFEDGRRVERAAEDLDEGDWVYVPDAIPQPASDGGTASIDTTGGMRPDPIDPGGGLSPARGAILGYLAGDGNVYYNRSEGSYGIRFTNAEEELLADFERVCTEAFDDATPVRHPSEQRPDGVETVRLHGKRYVDELLDAGLNLETYDGKRVPEAVTRASRPTKAAFVRALADSEGSMDERNVNIASSSYELLLGTKMLLSEFGVTCQIQTRPRGDKRDLYYLVITADDSLRLFNRHVGFTLDRKQSALDAACSRTTGTRTILDVIPDCGERFREVREALRLYQAECGLNSATLCNFENGDANFSFDAAETVLSSFAGRREQAAADLDRLEGDASWETLEEVKRRYHVSQRELAADTDYSQPQVSACWGEEQTLKAVVHERLRTIVEDVEDTDFEHLLDLVSGDVKWRRVRRVGRVKPPTEDGKKQVVKQRLADLIGGDVDTVGARARDLLAVQLDGSSWRELQSELSRFGISFSMVARHMSVVGSTVSRWFSRSVDGEDLETVRRTCHELIERKRDRIEVLLDELDQRRGPKVYDITVKGTHNFVANSMIVHNSEDRSAMHEALEQQHISVSKAGINATLKSRCSLLGAANPKYGRFDQYEPIAEQIDLEPALVSRFDLIFTVTDKPDGEKDRRLADHILMTNYAGELSTQRAQLATPNATEQDVEEASANVQPAIDPDLFRKYIAYAKRNCFPTMADEAREKIRDFYVDLRERGTEEDAPVPITARKLEALVRLAEASARVRLSDTVEVEDAERVIDIVRASLQDIGVDPETGQFDADVIETGTSKTQRDRIKNIRTLIAEIEDDYQEGAPVEEVLSRAAELGIDESKAEHEIEKLRQRGEVYEPQNDHLRTT